MDGVLHQRKGGAVNNPNPKRTTLGFRNSLDNKLTSIDAPTDELIRVLTEVAKKSAGKA